MTERVDFYVLPSAALKQCLSFACRLVEKAYLRNMRVVVLAESAADAQSLDDLLWTFREGSFVPHAVCRDDGAADPASPVHLTAEAARAPQADLLVNLSGRMPPEPGRFARIAEIIDADAERRRLGRERFRAYRDLKIPLQTHRSDDADEL